MSRIHKLLGAEPNDRYFQRLPSTGRVSVQGARLKESPLPDWIERELGQENESLTELVSQSRLTLVS